MTTTTSYFLRPRGLLIGAALAASVLAVVLASPASSAQTTVPAGTPLARQMYLAALQTWSLCLGAATTTWPSRATALSWPGYGHGVTIIQA